MNDDRVTIRAPERAESLQVHDWNTSEVPLIRVTKDGTTFDWPAIRAYLETSAPPWDTTRFVVQAAYAAYLEGIEKGKAP